MSEKLDPKAVEIFLLENLGPKKLGPTAYMTGPTRYRKLEEKYNKVSDKFPGCNSATLKSYGQTTR